MKNRFLTAIVVILAIVLCTAELKAGEKTEPLIRARSAILMNLESESVIYTQGINQKIAPASLTKIMTMYVVADRIADGKAKLTDKVRISANAAKQSGSRLNLKAGEVVSLDLLLQGAAIASGNDAAVAIAEHVGGSVPKFAKMMNDTAKKIGMTGSTFRNPSGLPAQGQLTTAADMLQLSRRYIIDHPEFLHYHSVLSVTHNKKTTTNKNPLLKSCEGTDGLKTGYVKASDFNLIATCQRDGIRLISVVMGAPRPKDMKTESERLIEAGFKTVSGRGETKVREWLAEDEAQGEAE